MTHTTTCGGLEVHQAATVAVVGDDGWRVIARSVVPIEADRLTAPNHVRAPPHGSESAAGAPDF